MERLSGQTNRVEVENQLASKLMREKVATENSVIRYFGDEGLVFSVSK